MSADSGAFWHDSGTRDWAPGANRAYSIQFSLLAPSLVPTREPLRPNVFHETPLDGPDNFPSIKASETALPLVNSRDFHVVSKAWRRLGKPRYVP